VISGLERDSKDPQKTMANELQEMCFSTLIAYFISLHYVEIKQVREAFTLYQHTLKEIENCVDCATRSQIASPALTYLQDSLVA
jgi:hypothetical protein